MALSAIVLGLAVPVFGAGPAAAADPAAKALTAAAFAAPPLRAGDAAGALTRETLLADGTPAEWRSGEVRLTEETSGAVDSLRISLAQPQLPHGRPLRLSGAPEGDAAYEVSLVRNWPSAVAFETRRFGVDFTPHAGLGMSNLGGVAEAGATVRVTGKRDRTLERLKQLGFADGTRMGDRGRWYLFAAASGRAVGLNMLRSDGAWNRAGWTTDPSSTLVGDAQLGVGWRKGVMQSSFGFIHREVKGEHMIFGQDTKPDSLVAFSFSIRARE
jgi:hypothetical protein